MKRQEVLATNLLPYPIGISVTSSDSSCVKDKLGRRHENRHYGAKLAPYLIRGRSLGGAVKMDSGFRRNDGVDRPQHSRAIVGLMNLSTN